MDDNPFWFITDELLLEPKPIIETKDFKPYAACLQNGHFNIGDNRVQNVSFTDNMYPFYLIHIESEKTFVYHE